MTIESIIARQILDSRGRPTLETTVILDAGVSGVASVPSGASTGSHEAVELRDDDPKHFDGLGVSLAISNVIGPINRTLHGLDVRNIRAIDQAMIDLDGTVNKSRMGANAILSVSLAAMRALAALTKQPLYRAIQQAYDLPERKIGDLPRPMMNIINGGRHANNALKVQEFMIVPNGKTMAERIERGVTVYQALGRLLNQQGLSTALGDEGGYAPPLPSEPAALDIIIQAISQSRLRAPKDIQLALDLAATEFYDATRQRYDFGETEGGLASVGMSGVLADWIKRYPLLSLEDPLAEDDWQGWTELTNTLGKKVRLIGDDLFTTNSGRLERGLAAKAANGIIIKLNQIGTLTETIDTALKAQETGLTIIVSHRSGETNDAFISDLAVALGAPFIKLGAPARGERVAKYNRLLAIAEELAA